MVKNLTSLLLTLRIAGLKSSTTPKNKAVTEILKKPCSIDGTPMFLSRVERTAVRLKETPALRVIK
jgi:hypothetical protein